MRLPGAAGLRAGAADAALPGPRHAPDGRYETLGDTTDRFATPIAGTPAQFAATGGRYGGSPADTEVAIFRRGYAFGRTGWGEDRPFADEGTSRCPSGQAWCSTAMTTAAA